MRSFYDIDREIKHQIESLEFSGAEDAWKSFTHKQAAAVKPEIDRQFNYRAAAILLVLFTAGIVLQVFAPAMYETRQDLVEVTPEPTSILDHSIESHQVTTLEKDSKLPVISSSSSSQPLLLEKASTSSNEALKSTTSLELNDEVISSNVTTQVRTSPTLLAGSEVAIAEDTATILPAESIQPTSAIISDLASIGSIDLSLNGEISTLLSAEPKIKRKYILPFAELAYSNQTAGLFSSIGVAVPLGSWQVEMSGGVQLRHNHKEKFKNKLINENLPDYDDLYAYEMSQLSNITAALKVRKRFGKKHGVILGARGKRNLTNRIQVNSEIAVLEDYFSSEPGFNSDIKYNSVASRYHNSKLADSGVASVNSRSYGLDLLLGYEFKLRNAALFLEIAKPVFPTFEIKKNNNDRVIYQSFDKPNIGVGFKYYI